MRRRSQQRSLSSIAIHIHNDGLLGQIGKKISNDAYFDVWMQIGISHRSIFVLPVGHVDVTEYNGGKPEEKL